MRLFLWLFLSSALAFNSYTQSVATSASLGPALKKGVGYHQTLTWGERTSDGQGYAWPIYTAERYKLDMNLLAQVKKAGFDHIRLSVDPGPYLYFRENEKRQHILELIRAEVERINALGLDVLVDLHPVGDIPNYDTEAYLSESFFPAYVNFVTQVATALVGVDLRHVALEPFNEPNCERDSESCNNRVLALHDAVRRVLPNILIVVDGGMWGAIEGLIPVRPERFAGSRVMFSFHYYSPFEFTHQGTHFGDTPEVKSFTWGLNFPAASNGFEAFYSEYLKRINDMNLTEKQRKELASKGENHLSEYFNGAGRAKAIAADMARVANWAAGHKLDGGAIYMGEFGAVQKTPTESCLYGDGPPHSDRLRWISDVRENAERQNFHWSYWALTPNCTGMQLVSTKDAQRLDPETLRALGL
ncbi:MAG: cellulase family glycosylhydrolase [Methylocystis sp.]